RRAVEAAGLPAGDRTSFLLKTEHIDTPTHKLEALKGLSTDRRIVAFFDNDPENLLAVQSELRSVDLVFFPSHFGRVPSEPAHGFFRISRWGAGLDTRPCRPDLVVEFLKALK